MEQSEIDRLMGKSPSAGEAARVPELSELPAVSAAVRGAVAASGSLETLLDVSLPVAIEFGRTHMTVQEVLELGSGSVIQLDRMVGEPIDIYISDRKLAEGEVVVIGEHFGVRITRILANAEAVGASRENA
ncbi:MAG: flagellar motor switch protein FliN [Gemmatimonadales bacterium]